MLETREPEIEFKELKNKIREAAKSQRAQGSPTTVEALRIVELVRKGEITDLINEGLAGADDFTRMAAMDTSQPDFAFRDRYKIRDLVKYDDCRFVWHAYLALLKREPDEPGFKSFVEQLRAGRRNKTDVLASLRYSAEGKRAHVRVDGLLARSLVRKFFRFTDRVRHGQRLASL